MSVNLQYNYAYVDLTTWECLGCVTMSYEVINEAYIPVPYSNDDYVGKYYNPADGFFYYEPEYITVFDPEA